MRSPSLLFGTSCKKDSNNNNTSNATKITGIRTKTFYAIDVNGNNTIESGEKTGPAAGDYDYNIYKRSGVVTDSSKTSGNTFKIDGTYVVAGDYVTISVSGFIQLLTLYLSIMRRPTPYRR